MRYLRNPRVREGLISGTLTVVAALAVRLLISNPQDHLHYSVLGELTGIDFGSWPNILYTGGGGDGEVFAVLAADPFGSGPSQLIPLPVYRFMRIGYSLAAWGLSGGNSRLVLPALFAVGLISVMAVGFYAGFLRDRLGPKSWFLILNPALYFGFAGDTAEPLGLLMLVIALTTSGFLGSVALGIIRPSYAPALWGKWKLLSGLAGAALIVRIFAVGRFGGSIFESVGGAFGIPLTSYFAEPSLAGFLVLASGIGTLVVGLTRRNWAWITSGLLVLILGDLVVDNPVNAIRAAGMLPVLWALTPRNVSEDGLKTPSASGHDRW